MLREGLFEECELSGHLKGLGEEPHGQVVGRGCVLLERLTVALEVLGQVVFTRELCEPGVPQCGFYSGSRVGAGRAWWTPRSRASRGRSTECASLRLQSASSGGPRAPLRRSCCSMCGSGCPSLHQSLLRLHRVFVLRDEGSEVLAHLCPFIQTALSFCDSCAP